MNAIILPYKNGSRSGAALANALGVRQIRLAGSTIHRQRSKTIINWGNSGRTLPPQGLGSGHYTLNPTVLVEIAANKLSTFESIKDNTRIPEYTTDYETALSWLSGVQPCKVVERHTLTGHSGAGIEVVEEMEDLSTDCPLYVKYVKKQDEYRIHIMDGQVIDVQRKARRSDVPDEDVNWQVRNHQNGFCYMRESVSPDTDVIVQALNAIEALGLDFGAVDVIWNAHQNKAHVLEVNTACGLEGTTLERYKVAFQELLTLGEVTPLEGYELGEGDEDDEPLDDSFNYAVVSAEASDETYALDVGEDVQTPAERSFQLGESVRTVGFEYTRHPRGTVGEVVDVRAHGCHVRANGMILFHRNEWLEHAQTPAQPAPPRQELTPETLRVGMRLRALQSNFHGTNLQVGDVVTVRSVSGRMFTTTCAFAFNRLHLNGEYFELVDDGVVQEAQTGLEEVEYFDSYERHYDEDFPLGCAVEVRYSGNVYPNTGWARTRSTPVHDGETGVVVGSTQNPFTERDMIAVKDSRGEIFVIATQGVRRVGNSTTSVTQSRSDITPPRAPLSKWLVAVDGNVNLEEGVFDTQEEAEMALVSSDFHNMRQLGHDVRVVSL